MSTPGIPYQVEYAAVVPDARHARTVSPAEAELVLGECLALTRKLLGGAFWHAFEELEAPTTWRAALATGRAKTQTDFELAAAVNQRRREFLPLFVERYEAAFREAIGGRAGTRRGDLDEATELALVEQGELNQQVALKTAIAVMNDAVADEKFALDLRVRALLSISADYGAFDNPWGVKSVCDALGSTCRELWRDEDRWRPIMECCVRVATPHLLQLYRELNAGLQDHGVLPLLRVRTRGRGGALSVQKTRREELFSTLSKLLASSRRIREPGELPEISIAVPEEATDESRVADAAPTAPPAPSTSGEPVAGPSNAANDAEATAPDVQWAPAAPSFRGLIAALTNLQRAHVASTPVPVPEPVATTAATTATTPSLAAGGGAAVAGGDAGTIVESDATAGVPPVAKKAKAPVPPHVNEIRRAEPHLIKYVDSAINQVIMYVVAGLMDYVFDDPYLTDEAKAVFGRLQITLLKAALLDPQVMSDPANPTRRFFDTLAETLVGLEDDDAESEAMLELAHHLAGQINQDFETDLGVFEAAHRELENRIDIEWVRLAQRLSQATPELLAQDARIEAREEARARLAARMSGSRVPMAVHSFLTTEWLDQLTDVYVEHGLDSPQWDVQMALIDDLLWSLGPEAGHQHKRLSHIVPQLVHAFRRASGAESDGAQAPRDARQRVRALRRRVPPGGRPLRGGRADAGADQPSNAPMPDPYDDQVVALARGDWCEFRHADAKHAVLAKLAWRSPIARNCCSPTATAPRRACTRRPR